jgi:hypothetical protein
MRKNSVTPPKAGAPGEPNLQEEIERFVATWGPDRETHSLLRPAFISRLRWLLNLYAEAALKHGAIPERGVPHGYHNAALPPVAAKQKSSSGMSPSEAFNEGQKILKERQK